MTTPFRILTTASLALGFAFIAPAKTPDGKTLVVLFAGKPSHGPGEHEHNAGVQLLAKCLAQGAPGVVTKVHLNAEWPGAEELAQADSFVVYSDGGGGHPLLKENYLEQLTKEMKRGAGFLCLHYAVEYPADKGGPQALDWMGGFFEANWSVNPHWTAEFKELPKHPISNGVKPFATLDEWYFHMRFREGAGKLTHVLAAIAPDSTMSRPDGHHSGNPTVRAAVAAKKPQSVAWAFERPEGGRGFGFTGGHFHQGWANDDQRKLVLNAILWTAKVEVPAGGVASKVTAEDLAANLDPKPPRKPRPAAPPAAAAKPAEAAVPGTSGGRRLGEQPNPAIAERYGMEKAKANMSTFTTPAGLEASLFAAEPQIQNPTNIDIDHRGRVWAVEAVNYRTTMRPWGMLRAEGDRVVILEDTNGDGTADKDTTFWQSTDLLAPLGICVLPQAKGTQVIVSAAPNVWLISDTDGDDKADKQQVLFKIKGSWDHDHQVHAFVFGADGKFYFNFGNSGQELQDADGKLLADLAGNRITNERKPYQQGKVYRSDHDLATGKPSNLETLGWNFRNNYEVCVDSFGTMWQSDNDDDGNKGVRINYVMEYGSYGYSDEANGSAWQTPRPNIEAEIPLRHWHLNDPGTIPNLLQTGAGSPTGILINEGAALGAQFTNQLIHCDAGPRTVRAYPVENDGAGYKATMVDVLTSTDQWYRPADVAIAPDGSLFVADWYDPGVGGHNMGDHEKGKIMGRRSRVASSSHSSSSSPLNLSTADAAVKALQSPNKATQYLAWQKLHALGGAAEPALLQLFKNESPRRRARALGLLVQIKGRAIKHLSAGMSDADSNVRIAAIRLTRTLAKTGGLDTSPLEEDRALVGRLLKDTPQVRREIAVSLCGAKDIAQLWVALAQQHDGKDRWYLEALGIGAKGNEDACFDAWFAAVGDKWNTPAGRDIIWRMRSAKTASLLAKIIQGQSVPDADKPRYLRSYDFLPGSAEKTNALVQLAGLGGNMNAIAAEALTRLKNTDLNSNPDVKAALDKQLAATAGTLRFVEIVRDFGLKGQGAAALDAALKNLQNPLANEALNIVFADPKAGEILDAALSGPQAEAVVTLLGTSSAPRTINTLTRIAIAPANPLPRRTAAVQALARSQTGAQAIIQLTKNNELPADLKSAATAALHLVQYPALKGDITALFPAPSALGGQPLPAIAELVKLKGDLARGNALTERAESSCDTSHRIGDKGADFAPALTEIGSKLPKEALYDAIINPNAGVSMGFETTQLETKNGTFGIGIVRSETNEEVVLALPGGATNSFTKRQIAKREKLPTSLMPSGLNQALSQQDFVDMVEYLFSLKKP